MSKEYITMPDPKGCSNLSTGIRSGVIPDFVLNSNTYKCDIIELSIKIRKNRIDIIADVTILDSAGNLLNKLPNKTFSVVDSPRIMKYEVDEKGLPDESTGVEVVAEKLSITNWDKLLGEQLIDDEAKPFFQYSIAN